MEEGCFVPLAFLSEQTIEPPLQFQLDIRTFRKRIPFKLLQKNLDIDRLISQNRTV